MPDWALSARIRMALAGVSAMSGSFAYGTGGVSTTPFLVARTGLRYATLAQAVAGAISGDTIKVAPGTYTIPAGVPGDTAPGMTRIPAGIQLNTLTIEWEVPGSMPVIDLSAYARAQGLSGGRTVAIEAGPDNRTLTVRGLHIIGDPEYGDPYGINSNQGYLPGVGFNGSPPSTLTVDLCKLVRWADGIKNTVYNRELSTVVTGSVIEDCTANFLTHGIYVNGRSLLVRGSTLRTTLAGLHPSANNAGHLIKSRTQETTIEGCLFDAAAGCASCIEAPSGGALTVEGNIILHYGQASSSDDNPAIKYGFEESARKITLSVSGTMPTVGQTITNGSDTATVYAVSGGNAIVYNMTAGTGLYGVGNTISLSGGAVIGTVTASSGSPDGSSQDGRTHSITVAQNTIRKDQPGNWSGTNATAIGMMWVAGNMTLDDGTALPRASIPRTVQNNIVGDIGCGNKTLSDGGDGSESYPNNSAVARSTISDLGVYSGADIACSPLVQDAAWAWVGQLLAAAARSADLKRGGRAVGLPAYLVGKTALQWFEVGSNTIRFTTGVDPNVDPAINSQVGQIDPRAFWARIFNLTGLVSAWGGGYYNDAFGEFGIFGGGHAGYFGNEGYAINLLDNAPAWRRRGYPSGSIQNPVTRDGNDFVRGSNTDVYGDERPVSVHTYSTLCGLPNGDVLFAPGGAKDSPIGGDWTKRIHLHRYSTDDYTLDGGVLDSSAYPGKSLTVYDPSRGVVWNFQQNRVLTINPTTRAPTFICSMPSECDMNGTASYDPVRDLIYLWGSFPGNVTLRVFNPTTGLAAAGGAYQPPLATIDSPLSVSTTWGCDWDETRNRLLAWNGGSTVHAFNFPASGTATSGTWTRTTLTTSTAVVTPGTADINNGTFGRWRVSKRLNAAFGFLSVEQKVFCLPLE